MLRLWNTQVTDLTPLIKLTHLHDLCLRDTPGRDLAPLAHLTNLTDLNLGDKRPCPANKASGRVKYDTQSNERPPPDENTSAQTGSKTHNVMSGGYIRSIQ